jgi:molybdopterin/thiamine biosynthesis adenylyltransferase
LTVGVVGAGGTGSPVIEQLTRLGVGYIVLADGEKLEASNISRVYGSSPSDVGEYKVQLMASMVARAGLGTKTLAIAQPVTYEAALKQFRACDVVFGCTDDFWGRSLLNTLSTYYCIPVIDMGVKIQSSGFRIQAISGRVTTLMPGKPCLYCRNQITAQDVANQSLEELSPREATSRRKEGYIPELPGAEPAVIAFTTATAALAIGELLQRTTGFKGQDYDLGELIFRFDESALYKPGAVQQPGCFCTNRALICKGDQPRFLDQSWRQT